MPDIKVSKLETPDVDLYYTVRGSGPMLLILQGGAGAAEGCEAAANLLAAQFTVVTYDRRGLSRSKPVRGGDFEIRTHAADAARLIEALSNQPAFVFGNSFGAVIVLELALRHPHLVRLAVTHEPPVYGLFEGAEAEAAARSNDELFAAYQRDGVGAGMKVLFARSGVDLNDREPDVLLPALPAGDPKAAQQHHANLQHFLSNDVPALIRYQPDASALATAKDKIVPAIGVSSKENAGRHGAAILAHELGCEAAELPGGHTGHVLRPRAFAAKLREMFSGEQIAAPPQKPNRT